MLTILSVLLVALFAIILLVLIEIAVPGKHGNRMKIALLPLTFIVSLVIGVFSAVIGGIFVAIAFFVGYTNNDEPIKTSMVKTAAWLRKCVVRRRG